MIKLTIKMAERIHERHFDREHYEKYFFAGYDECALFATGKWDELQQKRPWPMSTRNLRTKLAWRDGFNAGLDFIKELENHNQ